MEWRNLTYLSSDGIKKVTTNVATDNYESDIIEAKKYCKSRDIKFKRLSKTTFNGFG